MQYIYRILLIVGIFGAGLALAGQVKASDFEAAYSVDYTLDPETGLTHVEQEVVLTNKQSNLRANSYSLTIDSNNYKNLEAHDSRGPLQMQEDTKDGSTTITFTFNDRVIGVGNSLRWTIEYDSPSLAKRHGQVWDIAIPRIEEHTSYDITAYTARLLVPQSLGEAHYISPQAAEASTSGEYNVYTFNKDQVLPAGIVAAFGQAQVFTFTLKYHLHNPNIGQASTEIALPPDVPGQQQIIYKQLKPEPVSLRTDADGNTLAMYYLGPNKSLEVTFTGWARIQSHSPTLESTKTASELPAELVTAYTKGQKYWEVGDAELVKKVDDLTDPKKPVIENVRAIYNFATSTLQYNTARINKDLQRMGASAAYRDPKNAVCMEFTDLFVTMLRIAGIPAREVDGYAYTSDSDNQPIFYPGLGSDILHAWAQVYLPEDGWIMADPTWGSTTGGIDFLGRVDLNRIAFAIKGTSSQSPYAAGSYKTNDKQDGDVKVEFSTEDKVGQQSIELSMERTNMVAGLGSSLPLKIRNSGNTAIYNVALSTTSADPLSVDAKYKPNLHVILPGQTITSWIPLNSRGWFDRANARLTIKANGQSFYAEPVSNQKQFGIAVEPFFAAVVAPIAILIIVVLAIAAGSWYGLHRLHNRTGLSQSVSESPTPQS